MLAWVGPGGLGEGPEPDGWKGMEAGEGAMLGGDRSPVDCGGGCVGRVVRPLPAGAPRLEGAGRATVLFAAGVVAGVEEVGCG